MKIETKFILNNMKENKKRAIFTIISIILCTTIIFTALLLISIAKNGIKENIEKYYNDYHFEVKDIDNVEFDKIRNKKYIDKIYIQGENGKIEEVEKTSNLSNENNLFNVYIKYKDVKKVRDYTNDIIKSLELHSEDAERCQLNQKVLNLYGIIDAEISGGITTPVCRVRLNYMYVADILILLILVAFSILFIVILYNAFLITIDERKREYAILNSIGGTQKQILKMIFLEGTILGIIGIIIGGIISVICVKLVLIFLNNILINAGYEFKMIYDCKYIILGLFIIMCNIFISSIMPSVKASTTTVIEEIRNNKQIKYKKNITILEKILPIEGKLAVKNVKRQKNRYRIIMLLVVVCLVSYIATSTYIEYEKETAELIEEYDYDVKFFLTQETKFDYETIFNDYEKFSGDKIEYIKENMIGIFAVVNPDNLLIDLKSINSRNKGVWK